MLFRSVSYALAGCALASALVMPASLPAQEIPLEPCASLLVVQAEINGRSMRLLVDTAATSFLNLASFANGPTREVRVTSWKGTVETSARVVVVHELVLGRTKLVALALPAIDLSAIANSCGQKIDGVLGVDLLTKAGANIDVKRQIIRLPTVQDERGLEAAEEVRREVKQCVKAFNQDDQRSMADCLEPEIAFLAHDAELMGREFVVRNLCVRYLDHRHGAKLEIHEIAVHALGEAIWYEFEFAIVTADDSWTGHGLALWHKSDGRWRITGVQDIFEYAMSSRN